MNQEKILNAMDSATRHLEASLKLFSNKDEKESSHMAWQAASDIEYCLFLLSLLHSNEALSFSFKLKSSSKMEINPALTSALETLKEAKSSLENDDLLSAHEKTWQARSYLFKVQEVFEKKRKIGVEQASTPRA